MPDIVRRGVWFCVLRVLILIDLTGVAGYYYYYYKYYYYYRYKWENTIYMVLEEAGLDCMD